MFFFHEKKKIFFPQKAAGGLQWIFSSEHPLFVQLSAHGGPRAQIDYFNSSCAIYRIRVYLRQQSVISEFVFGSSFKNQKERRSDRDPGAAMINAVPYMSKNESHTRIRLSCARDSNKRPGKKRWQRKKVNAWEKRENIQLKIRKENIEFWKTKLESTFPIYETRKREMRER